MGEVKRLQGGKKVGMGTWVRDGGGNASSESREGKLVMGRVAMKKERGRDAVKKNFPFKN